MANGFRTIPSIVAQMAARQQLQLQAEAAQQNQLANQVALATQQEKLSQLQDPQFKASQQLEQQLGLELQRAQLARLQQTPQQEAESRLQSQLIEQLARGTNPSLVFEPQVSPEIAASRAIAEAQAGIPTTSFPGGDFTPLLPATEGRRAIGISPSAGIAATERDLQSKISLANARADASGVPIEYFTQIDGTVGMRSKKMFGDVAPVAGTLQTASGEAAKEAPKPTKGASGLSQFAIANISGKAGKAGLTQEDIDQKYTTNNVTDWNRLNLDANRLIQEDVENAAKIKSSALSAAERGKATSFIAAHKDLGKLSESLKEFKASGKEPDAWERAVGVALEAPPDGVWSALYQTTIGQGLSADARELNALKARVRSAVTKANAGLSQTEREIANVTQYSPATNDNLEQTLSKAAGLEEYLVGQVESITTDPKEWLKSLQSVTSGGVSSPVATPGINPQAPAPVKIGRFTVTPR